MEKKKRARKEEIEPPKSYVEKVIDDLSSPMYNFLFGDEDKAKEKGET